MRSYTRIWILTLLLAIFIAISCHGPEVWPPPPSIVGGYIGTYTRQVEGTDSNVIEPITWTFTDSIFVMDCDLAHYPSKDTTKWKCFASCGGNYVMGIGVLLSGPESSSPDSSRTFRACSGPYSPYGSYLLDQTSSGEIMMTSVTLNPQGKNVTRTIHIFKKS